MTDNLKLLPKEQWKVFRSIEILGPETIQFIGYIYYTRTLTENNYDIYVSDLLDDKILESIIEIYPNSTLHENKIIRWHGELDECFHRLDGETTLEFSIDFIPNINMVETINPYGLTISKPRLNLQFKVNTTAKHPRFKNIRKQTLIFIPYNEFENLLGLLKTVNTLD